MTAADALPAPPDGPPARTVAGGGAAAGAAALLAAVAAPGRVLVVGAGPAAVALAAALAERGIAADLLDPADRHAPAAAPAAGLAPAGVARYDLAACLDVLPGLEPAAAAALLDRLDAAADLVVLSAPPALDSVTARSPGTWAALLRDRGFTRRFDVDLTDLDPWAVLLQRRALDPREEIAAYEDALARLAAEAAARRAAVADLRERLAARVDAEVAAAQERQHAAEQRALVDRDALVGAQATAGRLSWELDRVREELAALRKDNDAILAGARALEADLRGRLEEADRLAERYERLEQQYVAVRASSRYKLGRLLLAPGSAMRRNWDSDL